MAEYTLTYSAGVEGWPSFYSFIPEYMVGMNQYLYSFNGGNLYRHNTNETRNNFYGTQYNSKMISVFNDVPLENKIFKTLNLESDDPWEADLISDIQTTGYIEAAWFSKKEASWFAFVRNEGAPVSTPQFELRSLNGIGRCTTVITLGAVSTISFALATNIGSIISVGDTVYSFVPPVPPAPPANNTPIVRGIVTDLHEKIFCEAVILTAGTFLGGMIHVGSKSFQAGRSGDKSSVELDLNSFKPTPASLAALA